MVGLFVGDSLVLSFLIKSRSRGLEVTFLFPRIILLVNQMREFSLEWKVLNSVEKPPRTELPKILLLLKNAISQNQNVHKFSLNSGKRIPDKEADEESERTRNTRPLHKI